MIHILERVTFHPVDVRHDSHCVLSLISAHLGRVLGEGCLEPLLTSSLRAFKTTVPCKLYVLTVLTRHLFTASDCLGFGLVFLEL